MSWYEANGEPVGFDAAVFDPGVDLKFVNNYAPLHTDRSRGGPDSCSP